GKDAEHARHRLGAPRIDAEDAGVRVLRAQHHRVGLAIDAEIVAEAAAAGGEPLVLLPDDGLTDGAEACFRGSRFLVEVGHRGRISAFLDHLRIALHAESRVYQSPLVPAKAGTQDGRSGLEVRASRRSPGTRSRGFPLGFTPAKAGAGMSGVSIRLLSRQGSRTATPAPSPQRLGETELMTIRVGQVEEPFAPFGVARRGVRAIAGRDHARMQGIDVGMVKDDAAPPRP